MYENNPVDETQVPFEIAQDDAAQAQGESLEELLTTADPANEAPAADGAQGNDSVPPAKEPGWIKQRVNRAVEKAVAEAEARVAARYEARIAPLMEAVLDRQAQDLVAAGEFKSIERAKEYVRLKGGITEAPQAQPQQQTNTQPRDAQGRFQSSPASEAHVRADILAQQATKIKASRGLDVMQTFNGDPEVKQKVISGEWDFYDVADHMASNSRRVPASVRTPNGAGAGAAVTTIDNMSDAQFQKMLDNIQYRGYRYKAE